MTEQTPQEILAAQIAVLQQNYVASFPQKKQAMLSAWQHLNEQPFDHEAAKKLEQMAHKLVGSGGLRGFGEITLSARDVETFMLELIANDKILPEDSSRFDVLFARLTDALDKAAANT